MITPDPVDLTRALATKSVDEMRALSARVKAMRRARAAAAAQDPNAFMEFVLRDEETGRTVRQAPIHERWQHLITHEPRLLIWSHVDAGKTAQVSIGRVLWELGRNPNLRIAVVTKTSDLAMKIVRAIGQYIAGSEELREVFPYLRPNRDPSLPWTSHKLTVERSVVAKDPSVQASGAYGNIHGARVDWLIIDDIIDVTNTRTSAPRESLWQWVRSTLFGRLTARSRVSVLGNAWHPEDLMHRLEREPRFRAYRFPVIDGAGALTWPERWNQRRIDAARADMGPLEFSRALLCQARDDETSRFKREFIDKGLSNGRGKQLCASAGLLYAALREEGELSEEEVARISTALLARGTEASRMAEAALPVRFFTGVDLAVSKSEAADLTCLFTLALLPDGRRRVVWIESGRWSAPEILERIEWTHREFGSNFIVENNAAQDYIVQMIRHQTAIPVTAFTTGRQKAHPEFGVEGLAAEFAAGKWVVPSGANGAQRSREVDLWLQGMYHYSPDQHTSDHLMASWFAREGARAYERSRQQSAGAKVRVITA